MSISDGNFSLMEMGLKYICENVDKPQWKNIRMAELGNQKILRYDKKKKREINLGPSKKYFSDLGVVHTSFDINGKDGATKINLSRPLPKKWFGKFDMVTNYGTTEHIENQWQVFCNIHNMLKVGGVSVHSIPLSGYWKEHCPYHYKGRFPEQLTKHNDYQIIHKEVQVRHKVNKLLNFVIQKMSDRDFQGEESFGNGITFSEDYEKNNDNLF